MAQEHLPVFVGVDTVRFDLGVSRAKAYQIIKDLNRELKTQYPQALVVSGKVSNGVQGATSGIKKQVV